MQGALIAANFNMPYIGTGERFCAITSATGRTDIGRAVRNYLDRGNWCARGSCDTIHQASVDAIATAAITS